VNSVLVSTTDAKFMTVDIKDFLYLNTPMNWYEYMHISVKGTPNIIMEKYQLQDLVYNGDILIKICKGMYSLPCWVVVESSVYVEKNQSMPSKRRCANRTHCRIMPDRICMCFV
jgi:hypothetical protein